MGNLRKVAEEKLGRLDKAHPPDSAAEALRLRHELEVHQIELELQNQELRAAQKASAEALERYTDLFDFAPVGYFNLGRDSVILLVNLTGAGLTGIERSRLLGTRLTLLVAMIDRRNFSDFLAEVFASETTRSCELKIESADGSHMAVHIKATASADGTYCRLVMTDITARKKAEQALRDNATFTDDVLNSLSDHVVVLDHEGTIIAVNEAWRLFARENGSAENDFLGVNYLTVCRESVLRCHPAGAEQTEAGIRAILEGGKAGFTVEYPCDSPAETRWFRLRLAPLNGGRQGVVVSHHDISEPKRAFDAANRSMEAVRLSERRFKALFDQAAMGVALADVADGRFVQVNRRYCEITGYSQAELERLTFADITHPSDAAHDRDNLEKLRTGVSREYTREKRYVRKDQSEIWVSITLSAMWAPGETPDYLVAIVQDITGRKLLEEQVRHAQKMEAVGTLAGGIAHDFNNILSAIVGYTEISLMTLGENAVVRENLFAVLKATARATSLVRQILAFSRQQSTARAPIALGTVVNECVGLLRAAIPTSIQFDLSLSADAPVVLADESQIHQVLMNLGTNAWYAMKDQPGQLTFKLERIVVDAAHAAREPRLHCGVYAHISVRDSGCGMNQATLRRVFEPFFTTKPVGEGTGLGLAVVHGIMNNHGGAVTVHSTPGEGTIFHLYFPENKVPPPPAQIIDDSAPRGRGERILVVDDEIPLVMMCQMALTALGYAVETTTQPAEALDWVRADPRRFALVLTDQTMPGMTGLVLAAQLRLINPELPVILTTGYMAALTPDQLKNAGVYRVLHKPANLQSLAVALRDALSAASSAKG